jgi:NAD(P) transhydrogenase
MDPRRFDLLVLGSGPAGEKAAAQAAWFGKSVAVVEKQAPLLGGACTNTGTLPSKTLRESALALTGMTSRGLEQAVLALPRPFTAAQLMYRERHVVERERGRIGRNLDRHRVTLYGGQASFVDEHTVRVAAPGQPEVLVRGDIILIATGSRPHRPAWIPFEEPEVYDSDEILALEKIPESMLVLGSGVIASEYACVFAALDTKVTIIDARDRLLGFLDREVGDAFQAELRRLGLTLHLDDAPVACSVDKESRVCTVTTKRGASLQAAAVLAAAGRAGNTQALNLEAVGLAPDSRGTLPVDESFRTKVPHIYAAGDVVGFPGLASTSMEQGRVAVCQAFGFSYKQRVSPMLPYGIYTIPELSYVGATEEDLKAKGIDYAVGRASMRDNARGEIIGADSGFLKLLFAADNKKLLGAHLMGPSATELIGIGQMALLQGATIDLFIDACFNYPTLSELYKYAAYDGLGALARRRTIVEPVVAAPME